MRLMKKLLIILFLGVCFSCGCSSKNAYVAPSRIVSSIDIYCKKSSGTIFRHYTDPGKVEAVLHYLRLLDPNGPTIVSQEAMEGDLFEIVVHTQDGGVRIHRQRSDSFAALHRRYWGRIDRSLGMRLGHMMTLLPSDEVDANNTDIPQKDVTIS